MKRIVVTSLLVASAIGLAGCSQNKAGNTSNTSNTTTGTAPAPATNSSAASPGGTSAAPAAGASADATNQNFTIRNNTGQTINELYVSTVSTDEWEEDILGRDTLPTGEAAQIAFERAETQCQWDLRVVFEKGQSLEERGVNLCQTGEIEVAQ